MLTVLLVMILLFIIASICYHYAKSSSNIYIYIKHIYIYKIYIYIIYIYVYKIDNNEKVCIKNRTCYYFDDMIRFKDFDFDKILLDIKIKQKYFD